MTTDTNTKPAVEVSPERKAAAAKLRAKIEKAEEGFDKFPEKRAAIIAILFEAAEDLRKEGGDAGREYLALLKMFRRHKGWTDSELAAVSKHLDTRSPTDWTEADCRLAYHYLDILDTFLACATPRTVDEHIDDLMAIARALRGALSEKARR
jgi:hypothetical protein